jgi:hypothetical protein
MTPAPTDEARARLINRTIGLKTLGEVEGARAAVQEWLRAHPGDEGMRAVDVQLARMAEELETDTPPSVTYLTTSTREPLPPIGTADDPTTGKGEESVASEA